MNRFFSKLEQGCTKNKMMLLWTTETTKQKGVGAVFVRCWLQNYILRCGVLSLNRALSIGREGLMCCLVQSTAYIPTVLALTVSCRACSNSFRELSRSIRPLMKKKIVGQKKQKDPGISTQYSSSGRPV